jgi:hypothetical protein
MFSRAFTLTVSELECLEVSVRTSSIRFRTPMAH